METVIPPIAKANIASALPLWPPAVFRSEVMVVCPGAAWGTGSGAIVELVVENVEEVEGAEVDVFVAEEGAITAVTAPQPGISPLICSSIQPWAPSSRKTF